MKHPAAYHIRLARLGAATDSGHLSDLIQTGIVEEVGTGVLQDPEDHERWGQVLLPGNKVYHIGGYKLGDSTFIATSDLIAYEEAAEA